MNISELMELEKYGLLVWRLEQSIGGLGIRYSVCEMSHGRYRCSERELSGRLLYTLEYSPQPTARCPEREWYVLGTMFRTTQEAVAECLRREKERSVPKMPKMVIITLDF
jgi:hypothetical protein